MFDRYSEAAGQVIFLARFEAGRVGSKVIDTEHLLLGLVLVDPETIAMIASPISEEKVRARSELWHAQAEALPTSMDLPLSDDAKRALEAADSLSLTHGCDYVRTEHLLLALFNGGPTHAARILEEANVSADALTKLVTSVPPAGQQPAVVFPFDGIWLPPES